MSLRCGVAARLLCCYVVAVPFSGADVLHCPSVAERCKTMQRDMMVGCSRRQIFLFFPFCWSVSAPPPPPPHPHTHTEKHICSRFSL